MIPFKSLLIIASSENSTMDARRSLLDMRARAAMEPGGAITPGRVKILIVEDNMLLSMQIEEALLDAGFDVVGKATSAEQAVACARQHRPDLMVIDIRLEGDRDGVDAAA